MAFVDFISKPHTKTKRNYLERVVDGDKAQCAAIAKQFGYEYWDGDRKYGYGGYSYDGRWREVAEAMARHYDLQPGASILDVGCGKGFLLYDFTQVVPRAAVRGIDVSAYAAAHAHDDVRPFIEVGSAVNLPFPDKSFDLVVSINVLHNLYIGDLFTALREIERVGRAKYVVMDSYRTEEEKVNLLYWQLTCECFYTPEEWRWIFEQTGYSGDHAFVFFE
jgi:protein-L-isoaspartate(D-aspartate) O-methyltransferase